MSVDTRSDGRVPIHRLESMDRDEARTTLTVEQYERWEAVNDHLEQLDEQRAEWEEDARVATDVIVRADVTDLAADVSVFGNDLGVYYSPEDERVRDAAERLADAFGVDADSDVEARAEELTADDVDADVIEDAKAALADLITVAVIEWNGKTWSDMVAAERDAVREAIRQPRPNGWGLAGLMDAWSEIQYAVEANRNERMERVHRFRDETRRGDRHATR